MSVMDKLTFWKHKDLDNDFKGTDLGLEKERNLGLDLGENSEIGAGLTPKDIPFEPEPSGPSPMAPMSPQRPPAFQQQMAPQMNNNSGTKDIEIISAKLDALKARLDSIDQRLENIERLAREGT